MQPELLLFDIGNTCIKVGLADSRGVMTSYNLRTDPAQTSDSLGLTLLELLRHAGAEPRFTACVASSVVPGFDPLLREAVQRYLGCPLWMVPQDMHIPLQNHYERPQEVGADRLVGAYEARRLHPGPESLIVVDFGTAVTFDCISGNAYLGGLIFPGPRTAISALARETAQLPRVNLDVDALEPAPGRSTSVSIQHGLVFGFACMVEGLTQRLKKGLPGDCLVLATGGFAPHQPRRLRCRAALALAGGPAPPVLRTSPLLRAVAAVPLRAAVGPGLPSRAGPGRPLLGKKDFCGKASLPPDNGPATARGGAAEKTTLSRGGRINLQRSDYEQQHCVCVCPRDPGFARQSDRGSGSFSGVRPQRPRGRAFRRLHRQP